VVVGSRRCSGRGERRCSDGSASGRAALRGADCGGAPGVAAAGVRAVCGGGGAPGERRSACRVLATGCSWRVEGLEGGCSRDWLELGGWS
jgi:hypothetical protein